MVRKFSRIHLVFLSFLTLWIVGGYVVFFPKISLTSCWSCSESSSEWENCSQFECNLVAVFDVIACCDNNGPYSECNITMGTSNVVRYELFGTVCGLGTPTECKSTWCTDNPDWSHMDWSYCYGMGMEINSYTAAVPRCDF